MSILERYEADIDKGLELGRRGYELVGKALLAIKEADLWVDGYSSFEGYSRIKYGYEKTQLNRLVNAASFLLELKESPIGNKVASPPNEAICREILKVKVWEEKDGRWYVDEERTPQKRLDMWEMVSSQLNGEVMIAADVRVLVDKYSGRGISDGPSLAKRKKQALTQLGKAMDRFCAIRWTASEKATYGKQVRERVKGW